MFKNKKLMLAVFVAVVAAMLVAGAAFADPAAVYIHGDGCAVPDLDGNVVPVAGNPSGDGPIIVTQSSNDNWNASCHGTLPETSRRPSKTFVWDESNLPPYAMCGVPGITPLPTHNMRIVIQPSGRVTLSCHFKAP